MSSNAVKDIERAIEALTSQELHELYSWLDRNYPEAIDISIQSDLKTGRLDNAIQRALDNERNGRVQSL
jgi:hypothetical protein